MSEPTSVFIIPQVCEDADISGHILGVYATKEHAERRVRSWWEEHERQGNGMPCACCGIDVVIDQYKVNR